MAISNNRKWQVDCIAAIQSDKLDEVDMQKNIYLAYNGSGFFVPLLPPALAIFVRHLSNFENVLGDLQRSSEELVSFLPDCPLLDRFTMFKNHLLEWGRFVDSINREDGSGKVDIVDALKSPHAQAVFPGEMIVPVPSTSSTAALGRNPDEVQGEGDGEQIVKNTEKVKKTENTCFCGKEFTNFTKLTKHFKKDHPISNNWQCSSCEKTYTSQSAMWKHFRTVHKDLYLYTCSECPKGSDEKSVIAAHMAKTHSKATPVEAILCPKCNSRFESNSSLKRHLAICGKPKDNKPFKCEICEQAYRSQELLQRHMKAKHPPKGESAPVYQCEICSNDEGVVRFSCRATLNKHMASAHNVTTPKKRPRLAAN